MNSPADKALVDAFLTPLDTPQQLKDWVFTYLDLDLPKGWVDPDSNSSPIDWMFAAYTAYRFNQGATTPGFVILSSRESYKTLSESVLSVILMCHFKCTIAHLAAIESQASKAIQYVNSFVTKVRPYVEATGKEIDSQSRRKISIIDDKGSIAYVNVIIATMQGANSEHTNIFSIDEVDVMRFPKAYEEAKLIPGMMGGQYPLTFKTSTRKFAFGMMEKELQNAAAAGEKVLRWNIIDVTEHCNASRHRPDLPKTKRYIHPRLPLQNLSVKEYEEVNVEKRKEYSEIECYSGCGNCALLPVCKMRLAERSKDDRGGLYKPIPFTINQFRKISPDMGEAQLMCWKPSSTGLVYPRFDETPKKGNLITLSEAWEKFTGTEASKDVTLGKLKDILLQKGVVFKVGGDFGFRHAFALVITAQVMGEWWLVDSVSIPGLEPDQMLAEAKRMKELYHVKQFFMDTNQPAYIKTWKKNGLACPTFTKDVQGGIGAVQTQIVDATGRRRLKVIKHDGNNWLIDGFRKHHYLLDSAGEPTHEPDDEEYADIMDSVRYAAQCMFAAKGNVTIAGQNHPPQQPPVNINDQGQHYTDWLTQKARSLATEDGGSVTDKDASGTVFWSFGTSEDEE